MVSGIHEHPSESIAEIELLVRHGVLITMDRAFSIIDDGAIAIDHGRIVAVGRDSELAASFRADTVIDAGGAPVHPGLIEGHLHCSYQLFRGALADQLEEEDAWREFESHFYRHVDDEDEHASALIASIEMIRNGTTAFIEPGTVLEPESAAAAAETVGIRAVLADSFIWDQPAHLAMGKSTDQERNAAPIPRVASDRASVRNRLGKALRRESASGLVTGHVAVLGLGTASTELMVEAKRIANAGNAILNFHQSYSPADTARDQERLGADPIEALMRLGVVDDRTTMAHVNHLTRREFDAIIQSGATAVWAPAASMMWGHGSCLDGPHAELYRKGASIALGSDSPNWSNSLNLFRQANLAILTTREARRDRTALVAEDGLRMATTCGAKALGMTDAIGSIELGKRADIVVHSLERSELLPLTDPVRNLVYSSGSSSVDTVIVEGKIVLRHGEFVAIDEKQLLLDASARSGPLLQRMGVRLEPNRFNGRRL